MTINPPTVISSTPSSIKIAWSAADAAGPVDYRVQYGRTNGRGYEVPADPGTLEYTIQGLEGGVTWYFSVFGDDHSPDGEALSAIVTFTTPTGDIFSDTNRRISWTLREFFRNKGEPYSTVSFVDTTADNFEAFPQTPLRGSESEIAVVQRGDFGFDRVLSGDAGVVIHQDYGILLSTGNLNPVRANAVKEVCLDALLDQGWTLGLGKRGVNGFSISGRDLITADSQSPQQESTPNPRQQVVMIVRVYHKKPVKRSAA